MSGSSEELPAMVLPTAEKSARWPAWGAWALALGQAGWSFAHRPPRWVLEAPPPVWSHGRMAFVTVGPEVMAGVAGGSVLVGFWLARRLGGAWTGLLAAGVLVLARAVGGGGTEALTVATALVLAGAWLTLRFADDAAVANGVALGGCLGAIPVFSQTGTFGGLAMVAWLGWQVRPPWRLWPVALGAAGPLAWLGVARGEQWRETWQWFFERAAQQLGRLVADVGAPGRGLEARSEFWWMIAALGAAGLAVLVVNWRRRAGGVLLAGMVVAMLGSVAAGAGSGWPGQFWILPLPLLIVAGACLLARASETGPVAMRVAIAGVIAGQVGLGVVAAGRKHGRASEVATVGARTFAEKNIADGGFIIAPQSLAGSLGSGGRWRFIDARLLAGFRGPGGPVPRPGEAANLAARERVWDELRARAKGGPVYWFTRSTASVDQALGGRADYEVVGEFEAPMAGRSGGRSGLGVERRGGRAGANQPRGEEVARAPGRELAPTVKVVRIVFATE